MNPKKKVNFVFWEHAAKETQRLNLEVTWNKGLTILWSRLCLDNIFCDANDPPFYQA